MVKQQKWFYRIILKNCYIFCSVVLLKQNEERKTKRPLMCTQSIKASLVITRNLLFLESQLRTKREFSRQQKSVFGVIARLSAPVGMMIKLDCLISPELTRIGGVLLAGLLNLFILGYTFESLLCQWVFPFKRWIPFFKRFHKQFPLGRSMG